jgi:hypothetical protein
MVIFPRNRVIFPPTLDLAIDLKTKKGVVDLSVSDKVQATWTPLGSIFMKKQVQDSCYQDATFLP